MSALPLPISQLTVPQLQAAFLAEQARIVTHATFSFRAIPCRQRRDDCVAEVVALCWRWFRDLARRGKDARAFISIASRPSGRTSGW